MHWTHDFLAGYEEAQSCLRMSMLCSDMVRPWACPLLARIVELALHRASHAHHHTALRDGHGGLVDEQHVATIRVIARITNSLEI